MVVDKPNGSAETKSAKVPTSASAARNRTRRSPTARSGKASMQHAAGKPGRNKAAFVRSQPLSTPAKDVVAAAARLGMVMTPDYVHKVRSTAKARSSFRGSGGKAPRKAASRNDFRFAKPLGVVRAGTPEAAFRKLVLELGMQRAKDLLADVERKLGALIRG